MNLIKYFVDANSNSAPFSGQSNFIWESGDIYMRWNKTSKVFSKLNEGIKASTQTHAIGTYTMLKVISRLVSGGQLEV